MRVDEILKDHVQHGYPPGPIAIERLLQASDKPGAGAPLDVALQTVPGPGPMPTLRSVPRAAKTATPAA